MRIIAALFPHSPSIPSDISAPKPDKGASSSLADPLVGGCPCKEGLCLITPATTCSDFFSCVKCFKRPHDYKDACIVSFPKGLENSAIKFVQNESWSGSKLAGEIAKQLAMQKSNERGVWNLTDA